MKSLGAEDVASIGGGEGIGIEPNLAIPEFNLDIQGLEDSWFDNGQTGVDAEHDGWDSPFRTNDTLKGNEVFVRLPVVNINEPKIVRAFDASRGDCGPRCISIERERHRQWCCAKQRKRPTPDSLILSGFWSRQLAKSRTRKCATTCLALCSSRVALLPPPWARTPTGPFAAFRYAAWHAGLEVPVRIVLFLPLPHGEQPAHIAYFFAKRGVEDQEAPEDFVSEVFLHERRISKVMRRSCGRSGAGRIDWLGRAERSWESKGTPSARVGLRAPLSPLT